MFCPSYSLFYEILCTFLLFLWDTDPNLATSLFLGHKIIVVTFVGTNQVATGRSWMVQFLLKGQFPAQRHRVCPSSEAPGYCDSGFEDNKLHPQCCWTSDFTLAGSLSSDLVKYPSQGDNQSIYLSITELPLKLGLGTFQNPKAERKDLANGLINLEMGSCMRTGWRHDHTDKSVCNTSRTGWGQQGEWGLCSRAIILGALH